ncbi:MAG: TrkH family potassium uptake protein [Candidatus Euphemobacter frigidus]|nr:TrkH family potassium uptake protein [Candidatus Euphemobacter frigidus]MDP8275458.1 TrkH family potassium uptake protein [Candidatus Euphemobacter frigidus]
MNAISRKTRFNASRLIFLSFLGTILFGTVLLILPFSTRSPGCMNIVDALFTATSATCVTGLVVVDIGSYFTPFGKAVILLLIQLGGLGIMTMSTFFLVMLGRRLSLKDRILMEDTLGEKKVKGLKGLIKLIVGMTVFLEALGAVLLAWRFHRAYGYPVDQAIIHGIFHSVSAFCNAGFSLYRTSLMRFGGDWCVTGLMGGLVLLGGIGFVVWYNLTHYYFWRRDKTRRGRVRLQSKIALTMSAILLLIMFLFLLTVEWDNALKGLTLSEKLSRSFFQAVTPRTAGFNTMSMNRLNPATIWVTIIMMFIGASPSSTGGGIKTCTFAVILASVFAMVTGKRQIIFRRRSIPDHIAVKAISIAVISLAVIFIACTLLLLVESTASGSFYHQGYISDIIFETVSAFGTVGLSIGITPHLSYPGKFIIILTMYVGRIGPLALALLIGRRAYPPAVVQYPEESVMVG